MHMVITLLQFIIGKTAIFTTKQQCHFVVLCLSPNSLAALARIDQRPWNSALPGTGTNHQSAVGDGLIYRVNYHRFGEQISGTGGAPHRSGRRIFPGLNQTEFR